MSLEQQLAKAAEAITTRKKGVASTGAGISAESGIMTFRDPGGLWDLLDGADGSGLLGVIARHPIKALELVSGFFDALDVARPNAAHTGLRELEKLGVLRSVVTQNIDNLHHEAGSEKVYELHGNVFRLRCLKRKRTRKLGREELFPLAREVIGDIKSLSPMAFYQALPRCECGGFMRPDVVSFGEPVQQLNQSFAEAESCGWMIIVGTSGMVYPAAALPGMAKKRGGLLIEINPNPSEFSDSVDIFLQGKAAEVMPQLVEAVKARVT